MGRAVDHDFRLIFLNSVYDNLRISVCRVIFQKRIFDEIYRISSVLIAFFRKIPDVVSNKDSAYLCVVADFSG
ncbi:hypothetical protein SDC9_203477 [bioreactor metagenome]|uniref:Uncharacterized protein n=1 Tax=bioreactor metagenome TaxID=1076179 RepID=A0A645J8H7_9ZZZZ